MPPCRPADTAQANHLSLVRRSSEGENIRPHYLVCANLRKPVARGEKNLAVRGPLPVASGEWWRGKAIGGAPASDSFGRASACDGLGFTLPTQVPARHWLAAFIGSEERSTQSSYCAHEAQRAAPLHNRRSPPYGSNCQARTRRSALRLCTADRLRRAAVFCAKCDTRVAFTSHDQPKRRSIAALQEIRAIRVTRGPQVKMQIANCKLALARSLDLGLPEA